MAVEILDETHRYPRADALRVALTALLRELGLEGRDVTVVLLTDEAMAERNAADRGVEGPTDVLSYPTLEPDDAGFPTVEHLGDVFIAVDVAARQAADHGLKPHEEVMVLAAHGLTHLRGFDHDTEVAWIPFQHAQDRILELARGAPGAEP